jgi:hypothetical protein
MKGIGKGSVFVFPKFLICLNCGKMESALSKKEVQLLKEEQHSFSADSSSANSSAA